MKNHWLAIMLGAAFLAVGIVALTVTTPGNAVQNPAQKIIVNAVDQDQSPAPALVLVTYTVKETAAATGWKPSNPKGKLTVVIPAAAQSVRISVKSANSAAAQSIDCALDKLPDPVKIVDPSKVTIIPLTAIVNGQPADPPQPTEARVEMRNADSQKTIAGGYTFKGKLTFTKIADQEKLEVKALALTRDHESEWVKLEKTYPGLVQPLINKQAKP